MGAIFAIVSVLWIIASTVKGGKQQPRLNPRRRQMMRRRANAAVSTAHYSHPQDNSEMVTGEDGDFEINLPGADEFHESQDKAGIPVRVRTTL